MAAWQKFNPFVEALAEKTHDLGSDTLKIALTNTAPTAGNAVLADIAQIGTSGGYVPATVPLVSSLQTGGTYSLVIDATTFTASGTDFDEFRYLVLFNDNAANKELIAWYDYGAGYVLPDGQPFTVNAGTVLTLA